VVSLAISPHRVKTMAAADASIGQRPGEEVSMKAVVQSRYGSPADVLALGDLPDPRPGDGEMLVRVRAAGVNWADCALTRGVPYILRAGYGVRRPRNPVRGTDVAGTVEAVGGGVTDLREGDEVFGSCTGAFAEHAVARAGDVVAKPETISFEEAAGVTMAGLVALQALRDIGRVQAGQRVLVNGASGGIGTFAVQVAKSLGAEVTGVCSTPHLALVTSLGADHVIDYTRDDFTRDGHRYDVILDMADDRSLAERRRALTPGGTLIPNNGAGGRWVGSLGRIVIARMASLVVRESFRPFLSTQKRDDLLALRGMLEDGSLRPVVGETKPIDEAAAAVERAGGGHATGKVVIVV
jgi:NADPH:quinone reductase-like Zn-dependent oxidoreductase